VLDHRKKLKILLLLFENLFEVEWFEDAGRDSGVGSSCRRCFLFSMFLVTSAQGGGARTVVAVDAWETVLSATRARDSDRGRLIRCVERRRTFFGLLCSGLSIGRSTPIARLARRRRLLEGRVSSTSKSSGRNAAGAEWKSTSAGVGLRSVAD